MLWQPRNGCNRLFSENKLEAAREKYYQLINSKQKVEPEVLLKLAYISEKNKEFSKALYFLNIYFERRPNELALVKMNELAAEHGIKGYQLSDFYILLLLIKQYFFIIMVLAVAIAAYVTIILLIKRRRNLKIELIQKIALFSYLVFLLGMLLVRGFFKQGIVNNDSASLRLDPSSAAEAVTKLQEGEKLSVLGADDVWLRVLYDSKFYYVHKTNIWLVN